ncbi:dihydrofolate reductase family protein [Methylocella sp. CPCC 101449]|uniref:dihydrofolate reductase family protein n=1 Tax=Methylocella sp. CPCC 101449 TaxID=2987531 RepID=UPI00288EB3A2|nr:dihydrofolate reductase family protein [Methylocella sp. CPCC 101449]MDT2021785.1 dihydrofolate reductase family protein [Methylocella sp. CPCC 101449]
MRKIIASTLISLDGVMQGPGCPHEDPVGGFVHGGWCAPLFDTDVGTFIGDIYARPFDLLLGRKTYDIFAAHWPYVGVDNEIGVLFNRVSKYVATRSEPELTWTNSRALGRDVVGNLRQLKKQNGPDLLVQGSSDLLQTLFAHGLVDELSLLVFPVILGDGKRLFGAGTTPAGLRLADSRISSNGVVMMTYLPDGQVETGSFSLEHPSEAELARRRGLMEFA